MKRRRKVGAQAELVAEVTERLERWYVRLDHFASSDGESEWFRAQAARQRDAIRAQLDLLAAGKPIVVGGWQVGRHRDGACRLSADGHVEPPLEGTS